MHDLDAERSSTMNGVRDTNTDQLAELLDRARHGSVDAFADVYDATAGSVYGVAVRVLGDPDRAEDVAREVYVRIWSGAHAFEPGRGTAHAWIMAVAHRAIVERLRADGGDGAARGDASYDDHLLSALAPQQRRAVALAYFDGQNCAEIARIMQLPLDTTRSRVQDALLRLGDRLGTRRVAGA